MAVDPQSPLDQPEEATAMTTRRNFIDVRSQIPIMIGDVFVKRWGERDIIWVALGKKNTKMQWYFVHTGWTNSSYHFTRNAMERSDWKQNRHFRYVGNIPAKYLNELLERKTLR